MILELFLWGRSSRQRAQIEELEARLAALEPPRPVEAETPRSGGGGGVVVLVLIVAVILLALAANSGPAETLVYVDGIPIPTARPNP